LSTTGDILRHAHGHVARLDPEVLSRDGLIVMVDIYEGRNGQLEKTAGPPSQRLAQQGPGGCRRYTAIYAVEI